jgi:phosphoglucosamine mutase
MLTAALIAGVCSTGADAIHVGVVPTAAVAFLVGHHRAAAGVAVTASHNPLPDNGLKFFDHGGWKYSDEAEAHLESLVRSSDPPGGRPVGLRVGRTREAPDSAEAYIDHLLRDTPRLDGLTAIVDCANGAAATIAPAAYRRAGVSVKEVASDTSGNMINCGVGATNLSHLSGALTGGGTHIGLAHDGDADRLVAVDEQLGIVDGSHLLAILALDRHERGGLPGNAFVTTSMSNSGLWSSMADHGIRVVEAPIGDRSVLAEMRRRGYVLGGEQYGHIIMLDRATTGDGILTALALMAIMVRRSTALHRLTQAWTPRPQVLVNVPVADRTVLEHRPDIARAVEAERHRLQDRGRLMVRMSTIEPVVRVMCEADAQADAERIVARIAELLRTTPP